MIRKFLNEMDINVSRFIFCHMKCFIPTLVAAVSSILFPNFISKIIDDGIGKNRLDLVILYWIEMLICGVTMILSNYLQSILYCDFEQGLYCDLKNKTLKKILNLKNDVEDKTFSGDLYKSLIDDLDNITSYLSVLLPELLIDVITLICTIYIMIKYYSLMGLFLLALVCMLVFSQPWFGRKIEEHSYVSREAGGNEASFLQEIISNSGTINMMGYSPIILDRYQDKSSSVKNTNKKMLNIRYLAQNVRLGINTVSLLITIVIGTMLVSRNKIGIGVVFAMTIYIQRVSAPLNNIVQNYLLAKSYTPFFNRIFEMCSKEKKNKGIGIFPEEKLERISIENLSYSFSENSTLYSNFSIEIAKGEILGIVGNSGTGKTTLIKILMSILPFEKGKIIFNGKYELQNLDEEYLHQNISVVPQNALILNGKLRDVLNPAKRKIEDSEIIHLLYLFAVDYKVFNYNLDYEIAEKGMNVSGGEAQKISLVRMAIENKAWIILDEPTSSMDYYSEKTICNALKEYLADRTAIIITHRPEILKICDKVIKLDNPEVV